MPALSAIIFDLGNVLVDWSVAAFLKDHGYSDANCARLLKGALSLEWHGIADLGVPIGENVRQRLSQYPDDIAAIQLYAERWPDTIRGEISGTVDILKSLSAQGMPLYALTNFPADQFPAFHQRFEFLKLFKSIVVSGEVGLKKPDPRIFALSLDRFGCDPETTLFIDDRHENCEAADRFGLHTHQFTQPDKLRDALEQLGLMAV